MSSRFTHELDDLVNVLRVDAERERIDAGEFLEEHRLALHHGHCRSRTDVAEAEHGAAVADDRDGVGLDRQGPRLRGVLVDRCAHTSNPRRVNHRKLVAGPDPRPGLDLDLAAGMQQERPVRDVVDLHSVERPHLAAHGFPMCGVGALEGDVAYDLTVLDAHEVDRAHDRAGFRDHAGDACKGARLPRETHPQRNAVGRRRLANDDGRRRKVVAGRREAVQIETDVVHFRFLP
jgi:hypothetical protein